MLSLRPYQQKAVEEVWLALKKNKDPVLLVASVGAGKSLMLADILLKIQLSGRRALCIVNNAELVRNNCATFITQGGRASIYCAALKCKDASAPVVFGTPQTILNGINKNEIIGKTKFNIIIVDEAHAINYINHRSNFMRVLRHYRTDYPDMRLLGATGTNFRFRGSAIVGEECLFKTQVGNITTYQLINDGYLIKPTFEIDKQLVIDFSKVKLKQNGLFDKKELEKVITGSTRLTELICQQVKHIMETQKRFGVFLFATTKKHAYEILSHLPSDESAIILGETPEHERTEILDNARTGRIKYLVNIAIISVGVDVPAYDTIAYLRPTESLVLLVQTMGRVLRLSPKTNKTNALVLDFAGNIERHRDWDDPILLDAVKQTIDRDKPLVISCPACQTMNTEHARRCVGLIKIAENQDKFDKQSRCDYYFEFKECLCGVKNDISARVCHACNSELIDPNDKLSFSAIINEQVKVSVQKVNYTITGSLRGLTINCEYVCTNDQNITGIVKEGFSTYSEKAKNMFYGQFVRKHCANASKYYMYLHDKSKVEEMLQYALLPQELILSKDINKSGYKIKKKIFA